MHLNISFAKWRQFRLGLMLISSTYGKPLADDPVPNVSRPRHVIGWMGYKGDVYSMYNLKPIQGKSMD